MRLLSRRVLLVLLLFGLPLLGGCAAGMQYQQVGPTFPPRGTAADVKIIEKGEPSEPYDRVGQITWDYRRSKFTPPKLQEIEGELRKKAYEVGGDAVVVRKLEEPRDPEAPLKLTADVVRFKR
jgi:hypothetical protein